MSLFNFFPVVIIVTEVDREFELLLQAIFGKDTIETFKIKRPAGWVDLMTAFESRKRGAGPYRTTHTTVSFPFSFIDFFKKRKVFFLVIYHNLILIPFLFL